MRPFLCLIVLTVLFACGESTSRITPPPHGSVRIATHNVHYIVLDQATGTWSVGDWEDRKESADQAFKALDADIVAFQEMESFGRGDTDNINLHRDWLLQNNPDYAAGANGDSAVFPSTQPIFYRTARFEMLDQGWFFFSDTPDVIYSRTFNGSYPAFASWVQLRDRNDGKTLTIYNVHFEFSSGSNRLLSAELTVDRMAPRLAAGERVVLTGDLNALRSFRTAQIFKDAGFIFAPVPGSTYHLNRGINLFGAIDHLAASGPVSLIGEPQVLRRKFDGRWPSDHYPVIGDFVLR
ncbi:Metal-dependent hydrolase, endonuclease/exonuclease/phosphatase family [Loktanella sp. DSM 29012]|uniref:endonuclease/exonuclease/phosphatase family protein n=1 Tax=Loktanella sp. DSM 29012 TaxID=1881056 RepID=UPI0008CDE144|nr:endonuclease/exonuclease/phosphatase family protein [Loktanella sp. DSM 29012]SEQ48192.1 Metal-dependent hydrolase, endonuclease/exonuclease/phosphatase family [Loktanella sp. DSM 29012]